MSLSAHPRPPAKYVQPSHTSGRRCITSSMYESAVRQSFRPEPPNSLRKARRLFSRIHWVTDWIAATLAEVFGHSRWVPVLSASTYWCTSNAKLSAGSTTRFHTSPSATKRDALSHCDDETRIRLRAPVSLMRKIAVWAVLAVSLIFFRLARCVFSTYARELRAVETETHLQRRIIPKETPAGCAKPGQSRTSRIRESCSDARHRIGLLIARAFGEMPVSWVRCQAAAVRSFNSSRERGRNGAAKKPRVNTRGGQSASKSRSGP